MTTESIDRFAAPAVVVGVDLNGLGVVRSLAQAGVPVAAVDTDLSKPTMRTRFGLKLPMSALHGPSFVRELVALRAQFQEKPVLFLTQEASVATLSAARDSVKDLYHF